MRFAHKVAVTVIFALGLLSDHIDTILQAKFC
jgi:hypothetical protein